jgi:hypothetical protein
MSGLPDRPDLDQLRRQARELLRAAADGEPHAAGRLAAVSPRVTLSAAQLALAREYGFPSWAALKAEVARRRSPATPPDWRSFSGAAAVQTPAGVLLPEVLTAGTSLAILSGSLTLSGNAQPAAAVPGRRVPAPGALLASLVPHARAVRDSRAEAEAAEAYMRALTGVGVVDDRGAWYALTGMSSSGLLGTPDRDVKLRVDPAPERETGWIELHGQDGTTARLLPSPRAVVRIGQLGPAQGTAAGWPGTSGAAQRADGPRLCRDIGVALPAVDGVRIHLDGLISRPGSWQLSGRAWPRWQDGSRATGPGTDPLSVRAEDDRGGSYLGIGFPGSGEPAEGPLTEPQEVALQFTSRLDPLARALKLTFRGAHEEITVDLQIGTT